MIAFLYGLRSTKNALKKYIAADRGKEKAVKNPVESLA
jgi:hypothetical protein